MRIPPPGLSPQQRAMWPYTDEELGITAFHHVLCAAIGVLVCAAVAAVIVLAR